MGLLDDLRDALGDVRGICADPDFGLRAYTTTLVVRTWSGGRPGVGTKTETATPIVEDGGGNVKVREVTTREVLASGGKYRDQDLRIGPLTPPHTLGGYDVTTLDPQPGVGAEIFFRVVGAGSPTGTLYKRVEIDVTDPLKIVLVVRRTGET